MVDKTSVSVSGVAIVSLIILVATIVLLPVEGGALSGADNLAIVQEQPVTIMPTDVPRSNHVVQEGRPTVLLLSLRNYCGKRRQSSPDPQRKYVSVTVVISNRVNPSTSMALEDAKLETEDGASYSLHEDNCAPAITMTESKRFNLLRVEYLFSIPADETPSLLRVNLGNEEVITKLLYHGSSLPDMPEQNSRRFTNLKLTASLI